jgi:hypothetical protein
VYLCFEELLQDGPVVHHSVGRVQLSGEAEGPRTAPPQDHYVPGVLSGFNTHYSIEGVGFNTHYSIEWGFNTRAAPPLSLYTWGFKWVKYTL